MFVTNRFSLTCFSIEILENVGIGQPTQEQIDRLEESLIHSLQLTVSALLTLSGAGIKSPSVRQMEMTKSEIEELICEYKNFGWNK